MRIYAFVNLLVLIFSVFCDLVVRVVAAIVI